MKRVICIILAALSLAISGCKKDDVTFIKPTNFYYLNSEVDFGVENAVIGYEIRETDSVIDLITFMDIYLDGPISEQLRRNFHKQTEVSQIYVADGGVYVRFNNFLAMRTGVDLTLTCACIALTLLDYTGADFVQISTEGALLEDSESITITRDDLLLLDAVAVNE